MENKKPSHKYYTVVLYDSIVQSLFTVSTKAALKSTKIICILVDTY